MSTLLLLRRLTLSGRKTDLKGRSFISTAQSDSFYEESHLALQQTLQAVIQKEIESHVNTWESQGQYPAHEVFKILGSAGLLGVSKPVEYGGSGLDFKYTVALNEELGKISCGGVPMSIAVQTDMSTPALSRFGSHELKKQFLEPSIKGDYVSCLGVSEPGAGSDVASIRTNARRNGDDLLINGSKMWITNGLQADWMCLLANTEDQESNPHRNKSLICLPMDTPGITIAKKIEKIGMLCSDTAEIYFEDVRVPQSYIIGKPGQGFTYQMLQFQEERIAAATLCLGPLERMLEETIEYTRNRKAFKSTILDNQYVQFKLAELATEVELLRSGVYRTTDAYLAGQDVTLLASMLKLKCGRLIRETSDTCLQFWGGMGFTSSVGISRAFRDFRLISIGGGADEVMLSIISKLMGLTSKK
uniref:Probable isovaleryl-CoA dehydrogenase n=1 Tax=Caligus rogercresseyi TaxID=217165 RepID=C1BP28_CALRO|nr:Probable isovaleryl-CoA dehydrogenase [Caligus rogercresseyi]